MNQSMKSILSSLALGSILLSSIAQASAVELSDKVTMQEAFIFLGNQYIIKTPESYNYIQLNYTNIVKDSLLEDALQILIYHDLIQNREVALPKSAPITIAGFSQLSEKILELSVSPTESSTTEYLTKQDLLTVQTKLDARKLEANSRVAEESVEIDTSLGKEVKILEDVYKTLLGSHYNRADLDGTELIQSAIQGLADGVGDKYTSYFPPVESTDFFSNLDGEFQGIGAYVEMNAPGELIIVSPIVGSPAEKAGIKGGDRVIKVDDKEVTEDNSISEVISWIKGPKGTTVTLTIEREGMITPLEIEVTRDLIIIKDVEYSTPERDTAYIQIKNFGEHVDEEFALALESIKADSRIKTIIFDVRNNPGGYLDKVSRMLGRFIEKGLPTAIVSSGISDQSYTSLGLEGLDLSEYKVIILQNGGSASASEIFTGTLKDYFPELTIIGEQSFGKGSVQSLKSYYDGSTLKFTTARWYTGKTRIGIDGVGITPDIQLEFDSERYEKYQKDNQLEKALSY